MSGLRTELLHVANQRKAALAFLALEDGVETIRFTQEGSKPGLGAPWSVNAVITIGGTDYQAILGLDRWSMSSEPLPATTPPTPAPVTVIYSDGSSEVLE